MNCAIADDFSRFTPGVTSTSTSERTRSGARSVSASAVSPPSDMPTTIFASGASARTAVSIATALSAGQYTWSSRCEECPCPGRSIATSGRPSASATVSQVCAFCAPPCSSTSSGAPVPQRSALICEPRADVDRDPLARPAARGSSIPNSSAFSWNSPNSSYAGAVTPSVDRIAAARAQGPVGACPRRDARVPPAAPTCATPAASSRTATRLR